MGRLLARVLFLLVALAGPAAACINDEELPGHEREFRSQYKWLPSFASEQASPSGPFPSDGVLIGVGAALLTGAVVTTLPRLRTRA